MHDPTDSMNKNKDGKKQGAAIYKESWSVVAIPRFDVCVDGSEIYK